MTNGMPTLSNMGIIFRRHGLLLHHADGAGAQAGPP